MSFLAIDSQKNLFTLQKSQLQFEQTLVMNRINQCTKEMGYITDQYPTDGTASSTGYKSYDDDPNYKQLELESEILESRQDSLDTQISVLENEISALKNLVNSNIKTSCGLNLIGS